MANEIVLDYLTGNALYALLLDATGQVYNTVSTNFETPADASWANYDITMTEAGTATGLYRGTMPGVAAGSYQVKVRKQAGGAPAVSDPLVGDGEIEWDGSAVVALNSRSTLAQSDILSDATAFAGANIDAILADTGTDGVVLADGAITAAKVASGAIDDAALAADVDTYQAKVWLIDDDSGTTDRYVVVWFKNGEPVTSGITTPTIQVIKAADASDLIASTALSQIGSTGLYQKTETTNRIVAGATYIAKVQATIDSAARTWYQPLGRDS